ncbi:unnamed protein product [Penicillium egyptiacum]|uniref:Dipeptidyl-peptidase V n=1 Tax=Penicillium egyptiacum TaxID=1303716 RepID=A0A9W4P9T2_9EURO|nr:unnamed protein product [Penicillium egyptiacum]
MTMAIRNRRTTPEALLEAPICSHPIPDASGNLAVYTQQTYSFRSHSMFAQICVQDINSPRSWAITDDPHANYPRWMGQSEQLVRPSQAPEGRYTMTRITNLMEYFQLGDIELNGSLDEDSLDFFKDTYFIAFIARDAESDQSTHMASSCYLCPFFGWTRYPPTDENYHAWRYRGLGGAMCSPAVNSGIISPPCARGKMDTPLTKIELYWEQWNLSPSAVSFASNGSLLIQVDREGRQVLYHLDLNTWPNEPTPTNLKLFDSLIPLGSVMDVTPLPGKSKQVLVSCDSFHSSRQVIIQDLPAQGPRSSPLPPFSRENFGLSKSQVDQIWFPGDEQRQIHAWVVKPSYFNPKQKYPLLYVIHNGPQHCWRERWDMRCHLAFFAEHGYIVVAPNPTGSTGYGHEFTDAIRGSWAGKPYSDLEKGLDYICESLKYVDTERAVALGLGYGGYMVTGCKVTTWAAGSEL